MKNLAMRWLEGWSAATGHPWTNENGVVRIEALMGSRRFEYLLVEPNVEEFGAITALIGGDSRDVLTVFTKKPDYYLVPHTGLVVDRDDEALITSSLARTRPTAPEGYELNWDIEGNRVSLQVLHGDELAAGGILALIGRDAIFDRIETMPRYQRRGLGRFVMQTLTNWAVDNGAELGIIAASADGQALYTDMGWKRECTMLMFRGTVDAVAGTVDTRSRA
ncbi:MAG: GNAT family N-acetyltransferase [Aeromicrobium sp.]